MCRMSRGQRLSENSTPTGFSTNCDRPYQISDRKTLSSSIGFKETRFTHFWLSLLMECLSSGLYVFVVCSTRISWTGSMIGHEPSLLAMAISSGLSMIILMCAFKSVHVNPAITVAFFVTGRISIVRAVCYVFVHCFGALAATAFLYTISIEGHAGSLGLDKPHRLLASWQILVVESVISFVVTITTFATSSYSSYSEARKYILSQLYSNSEQICVDTLRSQHHRVAQEFQPSTSTRTSRRVVAPCDFSQTNAPISIINTNHSQIIRNDCSPPNISSTQDLMNSVNNIGNNMNTHSYNMKLSPTNLCTNDLQYYSQVYDDYSDLNPNLYDRSNDNQFVNMYGQQNNSNTGVINNMNAGYNFNQTTSRAKTLPFHVIQYHDEDHDLVKSNPNGVIKPNKFPYNDDYDNHRIYATQLKTISDDNSLDSIEQAIKEESQSYGLNGFPFRVTNAQAFIIGFAYIAVSLSGIPASGASLNPARSFGPAFILNRWENHWIYWLGPILGSITAGLVYEFIFSPIRDSSVCFKPSLFQLNAQDMAAAHANKSKSSPWAYRQRLTAVAGPTSKPTINFPQSYSTSNVMQVTTARK